MVLEQAAKLTEDVRIRFAALLHDLGKAITPDHVLPSHRGHEERGIPLVEAFCARLRVPKDYQRLAVNVCRDHLCAHQAFALSPKPY